MKDLHSRFVTIDYNLPSFDFEALRENSEKWAIGGDFGVLPLLEFSQLASASETTP